MASTGNLRWVSPGPFAICVCRAAQRAINLYTNKQQPLTGHLCLEPALHAGVVARGDLRAAGTVQAALASGSQIPDWVQERASSPYMLQDINSTAPSGSKGRSRDQRSEAAAPIANVQQAFQELLSGPGASTEEVIRLLSHACSPGTGQPFDPALSTALQHWLEEAKRKKYSTQFESSWFAAALVQLQLLQAGDRHAEFKTLVLGSGAVEEPYLK